MALEDPGIIVIGKVDASIESLRVPGPLKVTIELLAHKAKAPARLDR